MFAIKGVLPADMAKRQPSASTVGRPKRFKDKDYYRELRDIDRNDLSGPSYHFIFAQRNRNEKTVEPLYWLASAAVVALIDLHED